VIAYSGAWPLAPSVVRNAVRPVLSDVDATGL